MACCGISFRISWWFCRLCQWAYQSVQNSRILYLPKRKHLLKFQIYLMLTLFDLHDLGKAFQMKDHSMHCIDGYSDCSTSSLHRMHRLFSLPENKTRWMDRQVDIACRYFSSCLYRCGDALLFLRHKAHNTVWIRNSPIPPTSVKIFRCQRALSFQWFPGVLIPCLLLPMRSQSWYDWMHSCIMSYTDWKIRHGVLRLLRKAACQKFVHNRCILIVFWWCKDTKYISNIKEKCTKSVADVCFLIHPRLISCIYGIILLHKIMNST